jgi:proline iminopeptidase
MPFSLNRRLFLHGAGSILLSLVAGGLPRVVAALPQPDRTGFVDVPGGRVWYSVHGARHLLTGRKVPLVAVSGGPGATHHYLLPLAELADERAVVLYDQLETGESDRPGNSTRWTVERSVAELADVRAALDLQRLVVLGQSWGGAVATEYAMTHPPGLLGLVLASPLVSTPRAMADMEAYRQQLPEDTRKILEKHEAAGTFHDDEYKKAVEQFSDLYTLRSSVYPEEMAAGEKGFNTALYYTMWGHTEFKAIGTLKDYDISRHLYIINVPTLFICGQYDEITPMACLDFGGEIDGAQVAIIPDASHNSHLEQRELFMHTLRKFLEPLG